MFMLIWWIAAPIGVGGFIIQLLRVKKGRSQLTYRELFGGARRRTPWNDSQRWTDPKVDDDIWGDSNPKE